MHLHGSRLKMKLCAFSTTVHTSRNMSYITPELTSTFSPCTRTPSYPSARPTSTSPTIHSSEINPCHDPQQVGIGFLADVPPTTSCNRQPPFGTRRQVSSWLFSLAWRPLSLMTLDDAQSNIAWELVVRSGYVNLPRTQLECVDRDLSFYPPAAQSGLGRRPCHGRSRSCALQHGALNLRRCPRESRGRPLLQYLDL